MVKKLFKHRISTKVQASKMDDLWPSEVPWAILQEKLGKMKRTKRKGNKRCITKVGGRHREKNTREGVFFLGGGVKGYLKGMFGNPSLAKQNIKQTGKTKKIKRETTNVFPYLSACPIPQVWRSITPAQCRKIIEAVPKRLKGIIKRDGNRLLGRRTQDV